MQRTLSPYERSWRAIALVLLPLALMFLKFVRPEAAAWLPFHPSCGAISGLPCIFCGTTRAMYCLLNGNWSRALYFNWLAFPLLAGLAALLATVLSEILLNRNFLERWPKIKVTRPSVAAFLAGLILLWVVQVTLAVTQHKTELLNPRGPLYSLVVRK